MKTIDFRSFERNLPKLFKSISGKNLRICVKFSNEKDLVFISRKEFNFIQKTINSYLNNIH